MHALLQAKVERNPSNLLAKIGKSRASDGVMPVRSRSLTGAYGTEAFKTKLSRGTIQRAELVRAQVTTSNIAKIVEPLEALVVIFCPADGEGPGVRLKG